MRALSMSTALQIALLLGLVGFVSAQAPVLPQCAQGCANEAAIKVGCSLSDPACLCKTAFSSNVVACSKTTSCSMTEQSDVSTVLQAMCGAASSVPSSSSGAGSPSLSSTPPASSTSAPLSSSGITVVPPLSPPLSLPSSLSSGGSSISASATAPTTVSSSGTGSSSAPSSTSSTGAASKSRVAGSVAFGAVVGVWAWLL